MRELYWLAIYLLNCWRGQIIPRAAEEPQSDADLHPSYYRARKDVSPVGEERCFSCFLIKRVITYKSTRKGEVGRQSVRKSQEGCSRLQDATATSELWGIGHWELGEWKVENHLPMILIHSWRRAPQDGSFYLLLPLGTAVPCRQRSWIWKPQEGWRITKSKI